MPFFFSSVFTNAESTASILGSSGNLNCKAYTEYAFGKDMKPSFFSLK